MIAAADAIEVRTAATSSGTRPATKRHAARVLLAELLADGPQRVLDIRARAEDAAIPWPTMRRAANQLGVVVIKDGTVGRGAVWWGRGAPTARRRKAAKGFRD